MVALRRDLHSHPEGGFRETKTRARLVKELIEMGVKKAEIRSIAKTGLLVDIWGKAKV